MTPPSEETPTVMNNSPGSRRFLFGTLLITLLGLLLRCFQLSAQPASPDDLSVAISTVNYLEFGQLGPTMWNHPDLRSLFIYFTLHVFGSGVLGVKGVSLLLGSCCVPLVSLVARRLLADERIALTAALLWAAEPLCIDFSRQAINDIYLAFFPLAGIYLVCRHRDRGGAWWLVAAGISFGCGIASKWSGVFPLAVTWALIAAAIWRAENVNRPEKLSRLMLSLATLVILPATIYLLTFIPWFGRGYSIGEWPALQQSMYKETSQHTGYHPLSEDRRDHWAYEWFVIPVTYADPFFNQEPGVGEGGANGMTQTVLLDVANPLVWLLVYPALAFLAFRGVRQRDEGALLLSGLFLISYLPLVLARRPIWLDTALSVLPYAMMMVAAFVWWLASQSRRPRLLVGGYLVLLLAVDGISYPLAIGKGAGIPALRGYLRAHSPVEIVLP